MSAAPKVETESALTDHPAIGIDLLLDPDLLEAPFLEVPTEAAIGPATGTATDDPTVVASPDPTDPTDRPGPHRGPTWVRLSCHAACELPFVISAVVASAYGWRPTSDDAAFAYRAWDVFSSHPPLVGDSSQSTLTTPVRAVYHPGPLLTWLYAVPVRLDHDHGILLAGAVLCAVAAALAVEAAWCARGWPAAVVASAAILTTVSVRPNIVLNPVWDPYCGLIWFFASVSLAWCVAGGRLRWWPLLVVAASLSAQAHQMYALGAAGLVLAAPVLGWCTSRRDRRRDRRSVATGLVVGLACWAAPLTQQLRSHPGNLTLLAGYSRGQTTLGWTFATRSLAAAVTPVPVWATSRTLALFPDILRLVEGRIWVALATLALLVLVAVLGLRSGAVDLAALAVVALIASLAAVASLSALSKPLVLGYAELVLWPAGMAVWTVGLWAAVTVVRRWRPGGSGRAPAHRRRPAGTGAGPAVPTRVGMASVAVILVLAGTAAAVHDSPSPAATPASEDPWPATAVTVTATADIEAHVPRGPVDLVVQGPDPYAALDALDGTMYSLHVDGWDPRSDFDPTAFGPEAVAPAGGQVATAVVDLAADGRVASIRLVPGRPTA
jgi:hypothetical protein